MALKFIRTGLIFVDIIIRGVVVFLQKSAEIKRVRYLLLLWLVFCMPAVVPGD